MSRSPNTKAQYTEQFIICINNDRSFKNSVPEPSHFESIRHWLKALISPGWKHGMLAAQGQPALICCWQLTVPLATAGGTFYEEVNVVKGIPELSCI